MKKYFPEIIAATLILAGGIFNIYYINKTNDNTFAIIYFSPILIYLAITNYQNKKKEIKVSNK